MSTQICQIKVFGYKFDYYEPVFSYIDREQEDEFVDKWGIPTGYYDFQSWKNTKPYKNSCLAYISDGMCAEYKYFGYIKQVTYVDNTHGDYFWEINPRFDEWIMERTKPNLELLTQRKFDTEPQLFDFKHYS